MAMPTPGGGQPSLQGIPPELFLMVVDSLPESIYDVVNLHATLRYTEKGLLIDFKILARTHADSLLANGKLCKQISYGRNSRKHFERMTLYPSTDSRLPTNKTYLQLLAARFPPTTDMDGKRINRNDIKAKYEADQARAREPLVFQKTVVHRGGGRPSKASRRATGMVRSDKRTYTELLQQTQPGERRRRIQGCQIRDDLAQAQKVEEQEAFRKFFYGLVFDINFKPAVCMGCLSQQALVIIFRGRMVRLCEACAVKFSKDARGVLYDNAELAKFKISISNLSETQRRLLSTLNFPNGASYVSADGANRIARLYHGSTFKQLNEVALSDETIITAASIFNLGAAVTSRITHSVDRDFWTLLNIDTTTFGFWQSVTMKIRKSIIGGSITPQPAATTVVNHAQVADLADQLLHMVLFPRYKRYTTAYLANRLIVRIDSIRRFETYAVAADRLPNTFTDRSASVVEAERLSERIHGRSLAKAIKDDRQLRRDRLGEYYLNSGALVNLIGRHNFAYFEVLVDIFTLATGRDTHAGSAVRKLRTSWFIDSYYSAMKQLVQDDDDAPFGAEVPATHVKAVHRANQFLNHCATDLLHRANDWSIGRQVTVHLPADPDVMGAPGPPEVLASWIYDSSILVNTSNIEPRGPVFRFGRVSWVYTPETAVTDWTIEL